MKSNNKYQILSNVGFVDFDGITTVKKNNSVHITTSDGRLIISSEDHPHIVNSKVVMAKHVMKGDILSTDNGECHVADVFTKNGEVLLYDIINVKNDHLFYANGILTHNCDCSFVSSGHTVIPGETLEKYSSKYVTQPLEKRGFDGELWVWEYPDYNKEYIVCADVGRGDGGDFSAFHVIDVETITQVAEYQAHIPTKEYGNMLVNIATEYNDALLVIENANIGWAAIQPAIDREYKNLYYSYKDTNVVDTAVLLRQGFDLVDKSKMVPGFTMSSRTRPMAISKVERYFREELCIIRSRRLINELQVFKWINGRPEAVHGYNDDLVMAFAIGMWVRDTAFKIRAEGLELTKKSIESIQKTSYTPTVYAANGNKDPYKIQVNKENIDLRWLLD